MTTKLTDLPPEVLMMIMEKSVPWSHALASVNRATFASFKGTPACEASRFIDFYVLQDEDCNPNAIACYSSQLSDFAFCLVWTCIGHTPIMSFCLEESHFVGNFAVPLERLMFMKQFGVDLIANAGKIVSEASWAGHVDTIAYLWEFIDEKWRRECFDVAFRCNHLPVMKYMYEIGYTSCSTYLSSAIRNCNVEVVRYLLSTNQFELNSHIIRSVVGRSNIEILTLLIDHGADMKLIGEDALIEAAGEGNIELTSHLLGLGVNAACRNNEPIIHLARQSMFWQSPKSKMGIATLLVQHGANVQARNNEAMITAMNLPIIREFVSLGAQASARNYEAYGDGGVYVRLQVLLYLYSVELPPNEKLLENLRYSIRSEQIDAVMFIVAVTFMNLDPKRMYDLWEAMEKRAFSQLISTWLNASHYHHIWTILLGKYGIGRGLNRLLIVDMDVAETPLLDDDDTLTRVFSFQCQVYDDVCMDYLITRYRGRIVPLITGHLRNITSMGSRYYTKSLASALLRNGEPLSFLSDSLIKEFCYQIDSKTLEFCDHDPRAKQWANSIFVRALHRRELAVALKALEIGTVQPYRWNHASIRFELAVVKWTSSDDRAELLDRLLTHDVRRGLLDISRCLEIALLTCVWPAVRIFLKHGAKLKHATMSARQIAWYQGIEL
jgi:hypothetical protein